MIGGYGWLNDLDLVHITDRTTDALWIGFSLTVFLLGYFALKEPDIFRLPSKEEVVRVAMPKLATPKEEEVVEQPEIDEALKESLVNFMTQHEPYFNPKLSLPELAVQLSTNTHELSRVINQGFGKNFNDFVNSYRVA